MSYIHKTVKAAEQLNYAFLISFAFVELFQKFNFNLKSDSQNLCE